MLEAIASSLTEMFSPTIIAERVSGMLANYKWITSDTLAYFTPRLTRRRKTAPSPSLMSGRRLIP
jgi:pyrroloquinoline-quinone synthase